MNFIKPNLNSLPEQVDINTNDIKNLKSVLKASYKTEKELETTTITLPITDTNAPQGTTCGWLYDSVGHLYSINGGDDTNLLLEYYTSLQGIQGNEGVGIATIENVGYTDGEGYTITHCKVTLTNGTEEFFDVQAKQGTQIKKFTANNLYDFAKKLWELNLSQVLNVNIKIKGESGTKRTYTLNYATNTPSYTNKEITTSSPITRSIKNLKPYSKSTDEEPGGTYNNTFLSTGNVTIESIRVGYNLSPSSTLSKIYLNQYEFIDTNQSLTINTYDISAGTPTLLEITYLE